MKTQTLQGLESLGVRGGVYTSPGSTERNVEKKPVNPVFMGFFVP